MTARETVVAVESLSKRYQLGHVHSDLLSERLSNLFRKNPAALGRESRTEFWALRDVTFEVREGDVLGIIGRNGAGKSTLLKVLSRLTAPTSGRARIHGRLASLLEVGTGFHPELTGRENIYLNATILGMRRREIDRRFDEIVAFSGVEPFLDTPVKRYSSGMYVRLAFGVAAHVEADILVIDEVLAVGDAEFQKRCLGKMSEVARGGRTVLFVSHNMTALRALCTTGLYLDQGQVVASDTAEACISLYEARNADATGDTWVRPEHLAQRPLTIANVVATVTGRQPRLKLVLEVTLQSTAIHKPALVAIDIADAGGAVLMQALPRYDPFIGGTGEQVLSIAIELPPLTPARYLANIWVGTMMETFDQVKEAIGFDIYDSPVPGRSYLHTRDHGFLVPHSTVDVVRSAD